MTIPDRLVPMSENANGSPREPATNNDHPSQTQPAIEQDLELFLKNDALPLIEVICVRECGKGPDAEDAIQETAILVVQNFPRILLGSIPNPWGWIMTVARNCALKIRTKRKRSSHSPLPDGLASDDDHVFGFEENELVRQIRYDLSFTEKMIVNLRCNGLSWKEIGKSTNLTPNAAQKRYGRLIGRLREWWAREDA